MSSSSSFSGSTSPSSSSSSARLFFLSSILCVFGLILTLLIILVLQKQQPQQQQSACENTINSKNSNSNNDNDVDNFIISSSPNTNNKNNNNNQTSCCQRSMMNRLSPLLTHDLVFLGDSNSLGVLLVNPLAGWQLHGGYPRVVIERRNAYFARKRIRKELAKGKANSNAVMFDHPLNTTSNDISSSLSPVCRDENIDLQQKEIPFYFSHQFKFPIYNISHSSPLLNHFYAPTSVFAMGSSGLSASDAISYQKSDIFADAKEKLSSLTSRTIVFIMFGTNDSTKRSSKESLSKEFIRRKYKKFIDLVLSQGAKTAVDEKENKLKKIVLITPPRVLSRCPGVFKFCLAHNLDVLENRIVPVVRELYQEYSSSSSSSSTTIEFQLIDFYKYLSTHFLPSPQKTHNKISTASDTDTDDNEKQSQERKQRQQREKWNAVSRSIRKFYQGDGVHLSVKGHQLLGELVWKNVSRSMMKKKRGTNYADVGCEG